MTTLFGIVHRDDSLVTFSEEGDREFAAAGWIANRAELIRELNLEPALSDAGIMRHAWLRWGEGALRRLYGDWAFAAWNHVTRTLFLARDHAGNTALYYHENANFFAFSSSRKALRSLDLPKMEMDELLLAQGLLSWRNVSGEGNDSGRTIHTGIRCLPPAHFLTMTPERVRVERYWSPGNTPQLLLARRSDYLPAFLEVFERAVRQYVRSDSPLASMLSGGLDSSSIVATAARILGETGQRLTAFTSVPAFGTSAYTGSYFGDEFPLARATADIAGNIDLARVEAVWVSPIAAIRRSLEILPEPVHGGCNLYWILELHRMAEAAGFRTLLTGSMGNASISWNGSIFSQSQFTQLRVLGPYRWLRASAHNRAPRPLLRAFERQRKARAWLEESAILPEFARRLQLMERYLDDSFTANPESADQRRRRMVESTSTFSGRTSAESGAAMGIAIRDPAADVRVVDFCLSVPDEIFIDPETGVDRWLVRQAMHGRLPESVRLNRRRGRQAGDLVPRLRQFAADVETALIEIEKGPAAEYVSIPAMRAAWDCVRAEDSPRAFKLAVTVLTRGIMTGLFVNGPGSRF